jgi:hypothetical protein
VLLPVALLAFGGPAVTTAIGRVAAQQEGRVDPESPQ